MDKKKTVQWVTRTAIMLAVTLAVQSLRYLIGNNPVSTLIIGSLVNLALVVTGSTVGLWGGLIVAVVSPIIAFFQGHLPLASMIPFVMAGNAFMAVAGTLWQHKKPLGWAAFPTALVLKYAVIVLGTALAMAAKKQIGLNPVLLTTAFSQQYVQPITAAVGILLAFPVVQGLRRAGIKR